MTDPNGSTASVGQCATLACLLEVTAPKPGNVHRGADFADLCMADFVAGAVAIGPAMNQAATQPVGRTVREAIAATRSAVSTNTNLGIVLLLAPLAAVPRQTPIADGIAEVLANLEPSDATDVYHAIMQAAPGGLGQVDKHDVHQAPPSDLLEAMELAADRDLVARQYVNGFEQILQEAAPRLVSLCATGMGLVDAVVHTHLQVMAEHPDSLIMRKRGPTEASQSAAMAAEVLAAADVADPQPNGDYWRKLHDLDFWLRSHSGRNPGTSADVVTAAMFVALREQQISQPFRW